MNEKQTGHAAATKRSTGRKLTITQKLVALIVLTTGAIVVFLSIYFPEQQIRASRATLEQKAATYGLLVSHQVASAVAFDDRETAREVFQSVAHDGDVDGLALLRADGTVLHSHGRKIAWLKAAARGVSEQKVVPIDHEIAVVAPVVSLEGPRGTLALELSTRGLEAEKARIRRTAVLAGALALCLGALLAYLIARSIGSRVEGIARVAGAVANGDLNQPTVRVRGSDEIAVLAEAFNAMLTKIRSLVDHIQKSAQEEQERLEGLVKARTRELDKRNQDMRLVLDNVQQGFLSVELDGRMSEERSAILAQWFGASQAGDTLFDYVERKFAGKGGWFRMTWEALREEWMPLELRIDQLPAELSADGRYYGFSYRPIFEGETLTSLLVMVSDNTALVEQRRAEEEERELVQVVRWLMTDRSGFHDFLNEASDLVAGVMNESTERVVRMRLVHTIKGNAAIFGFGSLVRVCHALEQQMVETQSDLSLEERERVQQAWTRLITRMGPFLSGRVSDSLDVPRAEYQRVLEAARKGGDLAQVTSMLASWELEPTEARMNRLAEHARGLAERLGKGTIDVHIESNDARLDPNAWSSFWQALVHVIRNAVDHGLETPDERVARGKPELGLLVLRTKFQGSQFAIEVEDNGQGIDWERVAASARRHGLAAETREDLHRALVTDAISTRDQVTEHSGRGVGLSAVREACIATGGRLSIESQPREGTKFRFEWDVDTHGRPVRADNDQGLDSVEGGTFGDSSSHGQYSAAQ